MSPRRTNRPRRFLSAAALAVCAHLLALFALGWRIPKPPTPLSPDNRPPVEIQLVRRPPTSPSPPAAPRSAAAHPPKPSPVRPSIVETPQPVAPAVTPSGQAVAEGAPDCAPEDLPLLTDAEKVHCRNQIDADKERRLARDVYKRAARQLAQTGGMAPAYRMSTEKQAYFAAVAHVYWLQSSNGPPMAGHLPGPVCALPSIPLLGGVEINRNIFAKKKMPRPPHSLKLGPLPCYLVPPQGLFTEESGLDPLDPQWRSKP